MLEKVEKDYYNDSTNKIIDFIIGYFGVGIAIIAISGIIGLIINLVFSNGQSYIDYDFFIFTILFSLIPIIGLLLTIIVSIWALKAKRKWIFIGVLFLFLTPIFLGLLLFGACLIAIGNY